MNDGRERHDFRDSAAIVGFVKRNEEGYHIATAQEEFALTEPRSHLPQLCQPASHRDFCARNLGYIPQSPKFAYLST